MSEAKQNYEIRDGRDTDGANVPASEQKNIIGWFANKQNRAFGWVITIPTDFDLNWLTQKDVDVKNVYRTYSDRGNTSLIRLNAKTGTYAFIDNDHLEKTDEIKFDKAVRYARLVIDDNAKAKSAFGV